MVINAYMPFTIKDFSILETIWTPKILNNFWYCKIFIFQMVKIKNFLILQIVTFWIFVNFFNWAIITILRNWLIFQIRKFLNGKFYKLENFQNCTTSKFCLFGKLLKFKKLANFGIVRPSDTRNTSNFADSHICPF